MNKNLEIKKKKYEEIGERFKERYKADMKIVNGVIAAIENNSKIEERDTLETIIFKKYLEMENVKKVADHVNEAGFRIKTDSWIGERKYTSNDITEIITSKNCLVEKKLKEIVQFLQNRNSEAASRIWR